MIQLKYQFAFGILVAGSLMGFLHIVHIDIAYISLMLITMFYVLANWEEIVYGSIPVGGKKRHFLRWLVKMNILVVSVAIFAYALIPISTILENLVKSLVEDLGIAQNLVLLNSLMPNALYYFMMTVFGVGVSYIGYRITVNFIEGY